MSRRVYSKFVYESSLLWPRQWRVLFDQPRFRLEALGGCGRVEDWRWSERSTSGPVQCKNDIDMRVSAVTLSRLALYALRLASTVSRA